MNYSLIWVSVHERLDFLLQYRPIIGLVPWALGALCLAEDLSVVPR